MPVQPPLSLDHDHPRGVGVIGVHEGEAAAERLSATPGVARRSPACRAGGPPTARAPSNRSPPARSPAAPPTSAITSPCPSPSAARRVGVPRDHVTRIGPRTPELLRGPVRDRVEVRLSKLGGLIPVCSKMSAAAMGTRTRPTTGEARGDGDQPHERPRVPNRYTVTYTRDARGSPSPPGMNRKTAPERRPAVVGRDADQPPDRGRDERGRAEDELRRAVRPAHDEQVDARGQHQGVNAEPAEQVALVGHPRAEARRRSVRHRSPAGQGSGPNTFRAARSTTPPASGSGLRILVRPSCPSSREVRDERDGHRDCPHRRRCDQPLPVLPDELLQLRPSARPQGNHSRRQEQRPAQRPGTTPCTRTRATGGTRRRASGSATARSG